jgi:hypothetical protein
MHLFMRRHRVWCRTERDRLTRIEVFLTDGATCLGFSDGRWVRLSPLEVGRLRGLLRDAVLTLGGAGGGSHDH